MSSLGTCLFMYVFSVLLFFNVSDLHSHFCLDGQEPAVSLHFENFQGHPEHEDEQSHEDFDYEINIEPLQIKSFHSDCCIVADDSGLLPQALAGHSRPFVPAAREALPSSPGTLRPPLRAPPVSA